MRTHITDSTDCSCVLNHKLVINFLGYLDTKMWDLAMRNADIQPVGRGEEARTGLGETGQTRMEEQLRDPNPGWHGSHWPGTRCPCLAPPWPSRALAPVALQGMA